MSAPSSAREALIVEALGQVAELLQRVDAVSESLATGCAALTRARAELAESLPKFQGDLHALGHAARTKAVAHIFQETLRARGESIQVQESAMKAAARKIFEEHLDKELRQIQEKLRQFLQRLDQPWIHWSHYAATAAMSMMLTWSVMSWFPMRCV